MAESFSVKAILSAQDNGFTKIMRAAQSSITSLGTVIAGGIGIASLGAAFKSVVNIGSSFEAQMSRVQAISGATNDEFEKLREQAIQLGADTTFSAKSAAEGMENLAAAGFSTNEIMSAMPGLLSMAAASGENLATSSDIAASTLRGFGLAAEDMSHVADVLAENANRTNSSVSQTGEAMKYIAPLARAAGISFEETAAAIGIMANAGIQGSQAGTTLRGALSRLSRPTDAMITAMNQLGVSFYDSSGKMKPLSEQIGMMRSALSGMTDEQKNNYLVTLYGQEALSGMLALINEGEGSLSSLTDAYRNCDGAAEKAADTMTNNFQGAIEQLKGSAETLGITIYDSISTQLTQVANIGTEAINKLTEAFKSGGLSGAIQFVFNELYNQITTLVPQMAEYGYQTLLTFSEGFSQGFPDVLSKVLTFIQGIGDSISTAAPVFIERGFEILSNLVQGIVNALPVLISQVPQIISTFANVINDNFPTILAKGAEIIGQLALGIINAIPVLVSNIPQIINAIVDVIMAFQWLNLGKNIIQLLGNGIKSMVGFAKSAGTNVFNAIKSSIQNLPSTLMNIGKSAMYDFTSTISGAVSTVRNAALRIVSSIESTILRLPSKMLSIGRNIVQGLWNGISGMTGWIIDKIGGFASSVINSIKGAFGIHSPSTIMRDEIGKYLAQGVGVGFQKYIPVSSIKKTINDTVKSISKINNSIDFGQHIGEGWTQDIISMARNAKKSMEELIAIPSLPDVPTPSRSGAGGGNWELSEDYSYTRNAKYTIVVPVYLEGKEVSRITAPFMEGDLKKREKVNNKINGIR